ncbi:MAG TPA: hypothetical protein VIX12_04645, partial [Candidatus Binataceae bacterium]
ICIERVLIAVRDLERSRGSWRAAGFAVSPDIRDSEGFQFVRLAAGAVAIDLCARSEVSADPLSSAIGSVAENGGGIAGWVWGARGVEDGTQSAEWVELPNGNGSLSARILTRPLPGTVTAVVETSSDQAARREALVARCGANPNTVDYLEHIVVMTPELEEAIAAHEAIGVPCKRIREAGGGMRQAFFKLEQTVIEVVGPARDRAGGWGLAFMCSNIGKAVSVAREAGLQATEPKSAIQGGRIARIVDPIDNVAVAFMQPA